MELMTKVLAFWGAIISTIALIWNVRNSLTDRANLKLVGERGYIMRFQLEESEKKSHKAILGNLKPEEDKADRLKIYAYNVGKRPIVISKVEIKYRKRAGEIKWQFWRKWRNGTMTMTSDFPRKLDAGDFALFEYGWHVVNEDFHDVILTTADDRKYRLTKTNIRKMKENHDRELKVFLIGRKGSNKSSKQDAQKPRASS
ncbi:MULTISPECIES: hypothetical protein [Thalassolituus]|uniref:hypothetical protein n=1 Tax=Thalassolituus TaxID=187492 RepID=UPI00264A080F|nr:MULTISPECIES: hypothetical protein [Thalassolituus]